MEKKYFFLKLIPCRPDFAMSMADEERKIMQLHVEYWRDLMKKGFVIVYGPVMDMKGPYGVGIIAVDNEEQVKQFINHDPASKINSYEFYPMRAILPDK
ncbi:MAG: YciI family protein [Ginsengibacter sp.]